MPDTPHRRQVVVATLVARAQLVNDSVRFEASYLGRLATYLPRQPRTATEPSTDVVGRGHLATLLAVIGHLIRALSEMPWYVLQYRRLARLHADKANSRQLVIGLASNRIRFHHGVAPRRNLELLLQPIGGNGKRRLALKVKEADCIIAVDAVPRSAYWQYRNECWNDRIFIVDGGFLFFLFVMSSLRMTGHMRSIRDCLRERRRLTESHRPSLSITLLAALIASSLDVLMAGAKDHEAILLTSHSILTEITRARLIEDPNCALIVEVMHGIGSINAETFSASVLAAGESFGSHDKHFFVPQVPGLPLYGVFRQQAWSTDEGAINAYLNRYFVNKKPPVADSVLSDIRRLLGEASNESIVVTMFGYAPIDGTLVGSPAFGTECLLLGMIAQLRRDLAINSVLVYVPHPVHATTTFDHPTFLENDIKICQDSIVAWLASDICISLASSAMFEGVYFGARGFTPLLPADRVFTDEYLALLARPLTTSREDLAESLRNVIANYRRPAHASTVERARQRLDVMLGANRPEPTAMGVSA